ncbi:MAG: hypothetical protein ACKVOJ_07880 [Sphingomonadaceae bacterium]
MLRNVSARLTFILPEGFCIAVRYTIVTQAILSSSPARSALIVAVLALALVGCGGGSTPGGATPPPAAMPPPSPTPPPPPPPNSIERKIVPSLTNQAITGSTSPHIAINPNPAVAAKGRLFVMLPGTIAVPRTYQLIVRTGPPRGYHAIGLN